MSDMTATLRIFEPYPGLFAYYDGRIAARRLHSPASNWLDDGAYDLGTASYAVVDGEDALVYDTHMSLDHARAIRSHLGKLGVVRFLVALSHWHKDHVAGNAVFADAQIIALHLTAERLTENRAAIEAGDPPIAPLVMPNHLFDRRLDVMVGQRRVELHHFDIHSADGAVLWMPDERLMLAGDTLEDTVTYVAEPARILTHIEELDRLRTWPIHRILPNHGDPERIASGGYDIRLIDANQSYLRWLTDPSTLAGCEPQSLRRFVANDEASRVLSYFEAYETVHQRNVAAVQAAIRHP